MIFIIHIKSLDHVALKNTQRRKAKFIYAESNSQYYHANKIKPLKNHLLIIQKHSAIVHIFCGIFISQLCHIYLNNCICMLWMLCSSKPFLVQGHQHVNFMMYVSWGSTCAPLKCTNVNPRVQRGSFSENIHSFITTKWNNSQAK